MLLIPRSGEDAGCDLRHLGEVGLRLGKPRRVALERLVGGVVQLADQVLAAEQNLGRRLVFRRLQEGKARPRRLGRARSPAARAISSVAGRRGSRAATTYRARHLPPLNEAVDDGRSSTDVRNSPREQTPTPSCEDGAVSPPKGSVVNQAGLAYDQVRGRAWAAKERHPRQGGGEGRSCIRHRLPRAYAGTIALPPTPCWATSRQRRTCSASECAALGAKVAQLEAEVARHQKQEDLVTKTLLAATSQATAIKQQARREAELILRKAEARLGERAAVAERLDREQAEAERELLRLRRLAEEMQQSLTSFLTRTLDELRPEAGPVAAVPARRRQQSVARPSARGCPQDGRKGVGRLARRGCAGGGVAFAARSETVIPVFVGIGAVLAAVAVGWATAGLVRRRRRSHRNQPDKRRALAARPAESGHGAAPADDMRARMVIQDAERTLAEARRRAEAIVEDAEQKATDIAAAAQQRGKALVASARESAGREALAITDDAKRTGRGIVREAEERAAQIVAAAQRQQALADEKRAELSQLLHHFLGRVQRSAGAGEANVLDLGEARQAPSERADAGR